MKKMAIIMQNLHKPQISQTKKQEIEEKIERIKQKSNRHKLLKSAAYSPRLDENTQADGDSVLHPWRENMSKNPKSKDTEELPQITKPKYQDYLEGVRSKRNTKQVYDKAFKSIMKDDNIDNAEKYERIKYQVSYLEEMAKRKEKLVRLKNQADHTTYEEASDMFIGAIKAKLSLLDQLDGIN